MRFESRASLPNFSMSTLPELSNGGYAVYQTARRGSAILNSDFVDVFRRFGSVFRWIEWRDGGSPASGEGGRRAAAGMGPSRLGQTRETTEAGVVRRCSKKRYVGPRAMTAARQAMTPR